MRKYLQNNYLITEYDNGTIVKTLVSNPIKTTTSTQPTIEEQIIELQNQNIILMDALATTFEEVLMLREQLGVMND